MSLESGHSACSKFSCDEKSIERYLRKYDRVNEESGNPSIETNHIDFNIKITLERGGIVGIYSMLIRKEINSCRGLIQIRGPIRNRCEGLLNGFFDETGAIKYN